MMEKDLRSRRLMNDQMTPEDLERINRLVADTIYHHNKSGVKISIKNGGMFHEY